MKLATTLRNRSMSLSYAPNSLETEIMMMYRTDFSFQVEICLKYHNDLK